MSETGKNKSSKDLVLPNGGYGWVIVFGTAFIGVFHLSFVIIFATVYGPTIIEMGHGTRGTSLVSNVGFLSESLFGLVSAQIIKTSSCRTTAIIGCFLASAGVLLTGFSTELWHMVMAFGIVRGIGISMITSSCFVIVNSYFTTKKGKAVGIYISGGVLGQVIMIHVASYLMSEYSFRGTTLLIGGLTMNSIIGALLLHPVQWHMKKRNTNSDENNQVLITSEIKKNKSETKFTDCEEKLVTHTSEILTQLTNDEKKATKNRNVLSDLAASMDLNLLKDIRFVSVMVGNALTFSSVVNFTTFSPLILNDMMGFDAITTKMVLSIMPAADIFGRLILPTITDKFKINSYTSVMLGCFLIVIGRQALILKQPVASVIILVIVNACGKSLIVIYEKISVTDTCRPDQVTGAVGLYMFVKALIILPAGYIVGWVRDYSGSFVLSITVLNLMVVTVVVMWLPPILWTKWKERQVNKTKIQIII